jgi:hypothetical protein
MRSTSIIVIIRFTAQLYLLTVIALCLLSQV